MSKSRIIIADTDFNYAITLKVKFVEEFFNEIDLEVITDKEYFNKIFSTPQRVDILIISEELFDVSLQRHNIGDIFLMMEQYDGRKTDALIINRLFKYTSINEIFNEIIGKSSDALKTNMIKKKETQIVMVYSACGGVGKTTLATGMSAFLSKSYKKVLYLNAERLQTFHHFLENQSTISTADIYTKLAIGNNSAIQEIIDCIRKEVFSYVPPFKASLVSLGVPYSVYEKIALSIKKTNEYDFIVIDADTTFDDEKARLLSISDKIIVVTEQTSTSVFATNQLLSNLNDINSDKYIFVCNKFDRMDDNALIIPNTAMEFTVNDYVERFRHYDQMGYEDFSQANGIQRAAFLIM